MISLEILKEIRFDDDGNEYGIGVIFEDSDGKIIRRAFSKGDNRRSPYDVAELLENMAYWIRRRFSA